MAPETQSNIRLWKWCLIPRICTYEWEGWVGCCCWQQVVRGRGGEWWSGEIGEILRNELDKSLYTCWVGLQIKKGNG